METTPPPFFKRGPSPAFRLSVCALLAVVLMMLDARLRYLEPVRQTLSVVLHPLQQIAAAPGTVLSRVGEYFDRQTFLQQENNQLKDTVLKQAATLHDLEALRRENAELRSLLDAKAKAVSTSIVAEVLYGARDPFSRKFFIDKGSNDGVQAGTAVVDGEGVVGQVTRVYPFVTEVTQIIDRDQAVPVQNLRSGLRAIVFGNGKDGTLDLRFMPVTVDVQVGDVLVTSGIDGVYPRGLPVAKVIAIDRDAASAFARITCVPLGGVDRRSHVLVLTSKRELPERPAAETAVENKGKHRRRGGA